MPIISWRCWEHVWTAKCATGLRPYARFYIPYVTDAFIEAKDNQYYNLKGVAINDQIIGDTAQQDGRFIIISGLMASLPLFGDIFGLWSCIQCMRLAVAKRTVHLPIPQISSAKRAISYTPTTRSKQDLRDIQYCKFCNQYP